MRLSLEGQSGWLWLAVVLVALELPQLHGQVKSPKEWKMARDNAKLRMQAMSDEPKYPVVGSAFFCKSRSEYQKEAEDGPSGYFFCDGYVDYAAACDATDPDSCNNEFAIKHFNNFQRALNVYSCSQYSAIWTCSNCSDAYKRWMCSQVYKKSYLPDTHLTEGGKVSGGITPSAYTISCPYPPVSLIVPADRVTAANAKPHFVKICSGIAKESETGRPLSVIELTASPKAACGDANGGCQGNVFLDPDSASSEDHFYVDSIIEITPESASDAKGQWAIIEAYDGKNRLAMFRAWKKPADAETIEIFRPDPNDMYTIYLHSKVLGTCRDSKNPKKRAGKACELRDLDKYSNLDYLPHSYMGGTRCGEDQQCFPVTPNSTDLFNDKGESQYPDQGYVCCPKNGPKLLAVGTAEEWQIFTLETTVTEEDEPKLNHSCYVQRDSSSDFDADTPAAEFFEQATPGISAVESSGCIFNFTRTVDMAQDFCVLRTCFPVCHDVVRKCPLDIEFNCPADSDRREYDHSVCNILLAHGCSMILMSSKEAAASSPASTECLDLNVEGYGPHPSQGHRILGLPPGASCVNKTVNVGLVRDEPPRPATAEGVQPPANLYWETRTGSEGSIRAFSLAGPKDTTVCKAPE